MPEKMPLKTFSAQMNLIQGPEQFHGDFPLTVADKMAGRMKVGCVDTELMWRGWMAIARARCWRSVTRTSSL
jgi:hypothetical protein